MTPPLTHDQCQKEMCAACGAKAGKKKVSDGLGVMIRKLAQPGWNPEVISYPTGICESCRRALFDCEKLKCNELPDRPGLLSRWKAFKLEKIEVPRKQLANSCSCSICLVRQSNPVGKPGFNNNLKEKKQIYTKGQEKTQETFTAKDTSCSLCFQAKTGRGIPHSCSDASRKINLAEKVISEEGAGAEQIVTKVLKHIVTEKGIGSNEELKLRQLKRW